MLDKQVYEQTKQAVARGDLSEVKLRFEECPIAFVLPSPNNQLINIARQHFDLEILGFLIAAGCEVDVVDHYGLHLGHDLLKMEESQSVLSMLSRFCGRGGDPNRRTGAPCSLLHCAATWNKPWAVPLLIRFGANPNLRELTDEKLTPLMVAAREGNAEVIAALLAARAEPILQNTSGVTALELAANAGHQECVVLLEEAARTRSDELKSDPQAVQIQLLCRKLACVVNERFPIEGDLMQLVRAVIELRFTGKCHFPVPELAGISPTDPRLIEIGETLGQWLIWRIRWERHLETAQELIELLQLFNTSNEVKLFRFQLGDELRRHEQFGANIQSLLLALNDCGEKHLLTRAGESIDTDDIATVYGEALQYLKQESHDH